MHTVLFLSLQQILLALRVEEMDQVLPECEIDGRPIAQAAPELLRQLGGGDPQDHVFAVLGGDVEVNLAAHHLGHVHLGGYKVLPRRQGKGNVLRTDAQNHILVAVPLFRQPCLLYTSDAADD